MCGITGAYYFNNNNDFSIIEKMTSALAHRGPDAQGLYNDNEIALGHRRLSIIDLSTESNQPLVDDTGNHILVFNGEIFNYKEIKQQLNSYSFKTNGDSEVVLAAYLKWGKECLHLFNGFFAFAIYNKLTKNIFIARDKMGVKPLYYYCDNNVFLFASEIRAILASTIVQKKINKYALQNYLQMQSFYAPHTIIENVKQLKNGHFIEINKSTIQIEQYWDITKEKNEIIVPKSLKEAEENVLQLLQQSIKRRLVADVPIAAFLSGGIDSSAIVALMSQYKNNVETFNIAFNEKEYDESAYAEIIAKKFKTNHHKIILSPNDFLQELPNALNAMDCPTADGINSYVVAKEIKKNGIKVALSGVGGDELFGGYKGFKYWRTVQHNKFIWAIPKTIRSAALKGIPNKLMNNRVKNLLLSSNAGIQNFYPLIREILPNKKIEIILNNKFDFQYEAVEAKKFPLISQFSIAEFLGYTQHTLLKDTDQFSMAVALEVREPFFDTDLVEYVLQIPDTFKNIDSPKQLLVNSLGKLLPKEIVNRPKKGFTFPWDSWMRTDLKLFCEENINYLCNHNDFNGAFIQKMWQNFLYNKDIRWPEIWQLVCLGHWMKKNL